MPRAALTDNQILEFRQRAIECATSLFVEGGLDALTMRGIAGRLGCSAMTPYRYFDNLEEIIALVRAEAFRRFADEQEAAFQTAAGPEDGLLKLKRAYIEFALREPELYSIMFELPRETDQNYPELKTETRRGFSCLVAAAESAVNASLMEGDPLTIAHILWANTHGLVSLHLSGKLLMGRKLDELSQIVLHIPHTQEEH
jgi:AcrR family transcriptional regulator